MNQLRLLTMLLTMLVATTVMYAEVIEGDCGRYQGSTIYGAYYSNNVVFTLDTETGLLTISPNSGLASAMGDFGPTSSNLSTPWRKYRSSIKRVVIEYGVTYIGDYAFVDCDNLEHAIIPYSVTGTGTHVFYGCESLRNIMIPSSIKAIEESTFNGCSSLSQIDIPNSVLSIGDNAFRGCSKLSTINLPNSISFIAESLFSGCSSLTEIDIPNTVTRIDEYAFTSCQSLRKLIIPSSVKTIDASAFLSIGSNELNVYFYPKSLGSYIVNIYGQGAVTIDCWSAFEDISTSTTLYADNSVFPNITKYWSGNIYDVNEPELTPTDLDCTLSGVSFRLNTGSLENVVINNVYANDEEIKSDADGVYRSNGIGRFLFKVNYNASDDAAQDAYYSIQSAYPSINCTSNTTTQTTMTLNVSASTDNTVPFVDRGVVVEQIGSFKCNDEGVVKLTGLKPGTKYSVEPYAIYHGQKYSGNTKEFSTKAFVAEIDIDAVTASSITVHGNYTNNSDVTILGSGFTENSSSSEFVAEKQMSLTGLDPDRQYTLYYAVNIEEGGYIRTSKTVMTNPLELVTDVAQPTSKTSVRLMATTNLDESETSVGFQWRRYDAPEEMPSTEVVCPVVDGVIVGSLRNVNPEVYYKYRPYYKSNSGSEYFGDWVVFFTGDASVYFEPEVRTYEPESVTNDGAVLTGYALEGTDDIVRQGFEYWPVDGTAMLRSAAAGQVQTVLASGIKMEVELTGLAAGTTYAYRAFATTDEGTIYGTEMQFTTEPASGIAEVVASEGLAVMLRSNPVDGGMAWVKVSGASGQVLRYRINSLSGQTVGGGVLPDYDGWNAIDASFAAGLYLLTVDDGLKSKTVKMIVR